MNKRRPECPSLARHAWLINADFLLRQEPDEDEEDEDEGDRKEEDDNEDDNDGTEDGYSE